MKMIVESFLTWNKKQGLHNPKTGKTYESTDTLEKETPKVDRRLEKRQSQGLELKEYKERAKLILKGRDYDTYDFDDKMFDAFKRGQDPKDFARKYILDNEL